MITWTQRAKAAISQKSHNGTAVTDEISVVKLSAVSSVPAEPISALPAGLSTVLPVRSPSVFEKHDSSGVVTEDPDRWCWPNSEAMTGGEIDRCTARLHEFSRRRVPKAQADCLADELVKRDRELDDRRMCLECMHLSGNEAGAWSCKNWNQAGLAVQTRNAGLPAKLVYDLHRCDGFAAEPQKVQDGSS